MRYNPLKPDQAPSKPRAAAVKASTATTIPTPRVVSHVPTLTENSVRDGFELRFPTKPDEAVLKAFRATQDLGREFQWHWHRKARFWYAKRNPTTRAFASAIVAPMTADAAAIVPSIAEPTPVIPPEEIAADIVARNFAMCADAVQNTNELNAPIIHVDFTSSTMPRAEAPWRARFLRKEGGA